jgi:hypothetical protein
MSLEDENKEFNEDTGSNKSNEETGENKTSPYEEKALEKGWVPREQYSGDPDEWVDAKEFLSRAPLFEAIHKANRKVKKIEQVNEALRENYKKVYDRAKEEAITELKKNLAAAAKDGNIEEVVQIQEKIEQVKESNNDVPATQDTNPFDTWVESNPWYERDNQLRTFATGMGIGLRNEHPDWPPEKIFNEVTKLTKEAFPNKFMNPNKAKASAVTTVNKSVSNTTGGKTKVPSPRQLPEEAKRNYRLLVKSESNPYGILTQEEFFKDYLAQGGELLEG